MLSGDRRQLEDAHDCAPPGPTPRRSHSVHTSPATGVVWPAVHPRSRRSAGPLRQWGEASSRTFHWDRAGAYTVNFQLKCFLELGVSLRDVATADPANSTAKRRAAINLRAPHAQGRRPDSDRLRGETRPQREARRNQRVIRRR